MVILLECQLLSWFKGVSICSQSDIASVVPSAGARSCEVRQVIERRGDLAPEREMWAFSATPSGMVSGQQKLRDSLGGTQLII